MIFGEAIGQGEPLPSQARRDDRGPHSEHSGGPRERRALDDRLRPRSGTTCVVALEIGMIGQKALGANIPMVNP